MEYRVIRNTDEYLMHYGVKGMKWGVRRTKDSFNTSFRRTMTDTHDRIIESRPRDISKSDHRKALRAANREGVQYRNTYKDKSRDRDRLSAMGNKYDEVINNIRGASNKNAISKGKKIVKRYFSFPKEIH